MRKILFTIYLCLVCSLLYGVPAKRGVITVSQSDGSTIEILRYGDEFFHYTTTTDDYLISQREGIYYYSDLSVSGEFTPTEQRASNPGERDNQQQRFLSSRTRRSDLGEIRVAAASSQRARSSSSSSVLLSPSVTRAEGEIRGLVILVEFADEEFTYTSDDFDRMLNDENYAENGGTGSARDFYSDNSMGQFEPSFDVVGPYTLNQNMAYYGGNSSSSDDMRPREMVAEACELADAAGLNFSNYDSDDDGYVDMVFVFYAGYNEAEGADSDTIWPHKWQLESPVYYDGRAVLVYACTSELRGSGHSTTSGQRPGQTTTVVESEMAGIGTFTHEYGHTLGLADSYDTDGTTNGESTGLYSFDIMSYGSYNNDGSTPPYYCAYQRYELGWIEPQQIATTGGFELENISTNSAYIVDTDVADEYFLFEYRDATSTGMRMWDGYIAYNVDGDVYYGDIDGMLVTHIDRSKNIVGNYTAAIQWLLNAPNNNLSHECARVVYSDPSVTTVSSFNDLRDMVFPSRLGNSDFGSSSSPAALSWSGEALGIELLDIRVNSGKVLFTNGSLDEEGVEDEEPQVDTTVYGDGYPFIYLEIGSWSDTRSTLKPILRNCSEYDSVTWSLNGVAISASTQQILAIGGEYTLICEITTGDEVERITKYFEL
ncbi:MAG: M6 family metalloprotease domain-containing protein [Rikenellaceae bacterium]